MKTARLGMITRRITGTHVHHSYANAAITDVVHFPPRKNIAGEAELLKNLIIPRPNDLFLVFFASFVVCIVLVINELWKLLRLRVICLVKNICRSERACYSPACKVPGESTLPIWCTSFANSYCSPSWP